jgi:hypothetical protein
MVSTEKSWCLQYSFVWSRPVVSNFNGKIVDIEKDLKSNWSQFFIHECITDITMNISTTQTTHL